MPVGYLLQRVLFNMRRKACTPTLIAVTFDLYMGMKECTLTLLPEYSRQERVYPHILHCLNIVGGKECTLPEYSALERVCTCSLLPEYSRWERSSLPPTLFATYI